MIDEQFLTTLSDLKNKRAYAKYEFNKKDLLRHAVFAQIILSEKANTKTIKDAENNARMSKEYITYVEELAQLELDYDLLHAKIQGMELRINLERDARIEKATELKHQNLTQL